MALLSILIVVLLILAVVNMFSGVPGGGYNRGWFSVSTLIIAALLALVQFTHIL